MVLQSINMKYDSELFQLLLKRGKTHDYVAGYIESFLFDDLANRFLEVKEAIERRTETIKREMYRKAD